MNLMLLQVRLLAERQFSSEKHLHQTDLRWFTQTNIFKEKGQKPRP